MTLAAQANLYCTQLDIQHLLSVVGTTARLDDDDTGTITTDQQLGMQQAMNYATARVKFYAQPRYDDIGLASSWMANEWATVIATHWLCTRRGNPVPDSLKELMYGDGTAANRGVMGDLSEVRKGIGKIPDIGTRNVEWPAWSNMRVDPAYRLRKIRVERPISENTPTQYPQQIDRGAEFMATEN